MRLVGVVGAMVGLSLASCAQAYSVELADKLRQAVQKGDAEASYHLGMLYNNGIGVDQDSAEAFRHFKKAADAGDPLGAYKVGCYYAGQFPGAVPVDEAQALHYKLKAAEAGYKLAQLDAGIIYTRREDYARALRWFEAASKQGDAQALYNLSVFYKDGLGTAPSAARSHALFRLAHLAAQGTVSEGAQKQLDELWAAMSTGEQADSARIEKTWVTGPTPLTRLAVAGLERAKLVAEKPR